MTLACDDVLPADELGGVFGSNVFPLDILTSKDFDSPVASAPLNVGALFCSWGNAEVDYDWNFNPEFRGGTLRVMPVSDEDWAAYGSEPVSEDPDYPGVFRSFPDEEFGSWCWSTNDGRGQSSCYAEGRVNDYWVHFSSESLADNAALSVEELHEIVQPVFDRLVTALNEQGPPAPVWSPATTSVAMPQDCTTVLTAEQAEALSGHSPLSIGSPWDGPRRGYGFWTLQSLGAQRCALMLHDSEATAGGVSILKDGAWRARELNDELLRSDAAETVELAGLPAEDTAALSCLEPELPCTLNFSYGGHWVMVSFGPIIEEWSGTDLTEGRSNIIEIAETVLANWAAAA